MVVSRSFIFVNINVIYLIRGKELLVMDIDTSSIIQIFQSQEPITYRNWVSEQNLGMISKKVNLIQSSLFGYSNINVVLR
jgi:hypothetical protein